MGKITIRHAQGVVGRVMNVRLHDSGIHAKSVAIFQAEIHRRVHHQLIDAFTVSGVSR